MRKHIILFFSALLFLFACNDDKETKGIIPLKQMASLLVDVHLVDGAIANQPNADSLYHNGTGKYFLVFKQHHTDSAQFRKSMTYYTRHPDIAMTMYDDVIKVLQAKADSMNNLVAKANEATRKRVEAKEKKEEKARQDSASAKMKQDGQKIQLDLIDKERRMRMTRPLPKGGKSDPKLKSFKKGL